MPIFRVFCLIALFTFCTLPVSAQVDNSPERKQQILKNLQYLFPQLSDFAIEMGEISASEVEGLEEGRFVVQGQQVERFLISSDNTVFYLMTAGPFDVSLSGDDLNAALGERAAEERARAQAVAENLAPHIAGMPSVGPEDAPVTIVEFSDFQCPYCSRAAENLKSMMATRGKEVRIVYMQFPLESIHPWARAASVASLCAARQSTEAFWTLHDGYFEKQQEIDTDNLLETSQSILEDSGIDLTTWNACASGTNAPLYNEIDAQIQSALDLGISLGVQSTPAFFVNGRAYRGAESVEVMREWVDQALADAEEE